jgi:hypothetical protein
LKILIIAAAMTVITAKDSLQLKKIDNMIKTLDSLKIRVDKIIKDAENEQTRIQENDIIRRFKNKNK